MMHKYAHLLSLDGLTPADFAALLAAASAQRTDRLDFALAGKNLALIFEKPSLRTRVTFEVAIRQLGGWPIMLGSEGRLGARESIPDLARNLSLWVDGIVARVFRHSDLQDMANYSTVPVVNALSDWEHPCQALADLLTLSDVWRDFQDKLVAYVGDWNNVSRSLWKACELSGIGFRAVCPKGYGPLSEENVPWSPDPAAVEGADAIYTDVWTSMGKEDEIEERASIFRPYQVNDQLMATTGKPAFFMHCLPANRGLEVTDTVMDSEHSLVFRQAANRLPSEKAILISLLEHAHEAASAAGKERDSRMFVNDHVDQGRLWGEIL